MNIEHRTFSIEC